MKEFIKQSILEDKANYSIIYHQYENEIKKLGATLFRKWLSVELDVPMEKIKVNSLYAVIHRMKNKKGKGNSHHFLTETKTEGSTKSGFKFSSVDEIPTKPNIEEM
jgi:hypothetical protein